LRILISIFCFLLIGHLLISHLLLGYLLIGYMLLAFSFFQEGLVLVELDHKISHFKIRKDYFNSAEQ
jgi:hypothetical protein